MNIVAIYRRSPAVAISGGNWRRWHEWVASRPPSVQALIADFPPGTEFATDEGYWFLLGYGENDDLIVAAIEPYGHHHDAMSVRHRICASHLRESPAYAPACARAAPPQ